MECLACVSLCGNVSTGDVVHPMLFGMFSILQSIESLYAMVKGCPVVFDVLFAQGMKDTEL